MEVDYILTSDEKRAIFEGSAEIYGDRVPCLYVREHMENGCVDEYLIFNYKMAWINEAETVEAYLAESVEASEIERDDEIIASFERAGRKEGEK